MNTPIAESVEGVNHSSIVYENLMSDDPISEVIEVIHNEYFTLSYSKSYRDLKMNFSIEGDEQDLHVVRTLHVALISIPELKKILNDLRK